MPTPLKLEKPPAGSAHKTPSPPQKPLKLSLKHTVPERMIINENGEKIEITNGNDGYLNRETSLLVNQQKSVQVDVVSAISPTNQSEQCRIM